MIVAWIPLSELADADRFYKMHIHGGPWEVLRRYGVYPERGGQILWRDDHVDGFRIITHWLPEDLDRPDIMRGLEPTFEIIDELAQPKKSISPVVLIWAVVCFSLELGALWAALIRKPPLTLFLYLAALFCFCFGVFKLRSWTREAQTNGTPRGGS